MCMLLKQPVQSELTRTKALYYIILQRNTVADRGIACSLLKRNNIRYFTYLLNKEKHTTILLKNIKINFEEQKVLNTLYMQQIKEINFINL